MVVNISLSMLNRNRPLIIKARREEDTPVRQEEPVGIRDTHIDIPPGAIVTRTLMAEHGTTLGANLGNMHRQIKLFDDAHIAISQLLGKTDGMGMRLRREYLRQCDQARTHGHGIAIECSQVHHFLVVDMAHDFLTPAESANRRTPSNGLGKADEVWL